MSQLLPDAVVAPRSETPESVPITNETSERIVRTLVVGLPPAALLCAGWLAWGGTLHWQDLVVLAITYTLSGLGVTVGYPPPVHASQLQDDPWSARRPRDPRLDVGGGTGDRMGRDAPQAPQLLGPPGRSAQPACRSGGRLARRAPRSRARAHRLDVPRQGHGQPARAMRRDLLADRDLRVISRLFPLWVVLGLAVPFGAGVCARRARSSARSPACCGAERCGSSCCTTPPSASTPCVTSSGGGRSRPVTSRAPSRGWRRSRSGSRGTTTITRSRRRPGTGSGAGSSIPAHG